MKRIKGLFGLGAAVAAALTLGACSQDETAGGDGALCPMELTATGLEPMVTPMTRATVHGDWDNVTTVAVKVGSEVDGVVKLYTVADGATTEATLTSTDPFYWPASGDVTVSAWWPYNMTDIKTKPAVEVQSNQSGGGYAASDFIEAVAQSVTKDNNALVFTHRTAKICVKLTAADGSQLTGAVVSIAVGGQTVEECLNASADGHLALIAPTAAAELTVTITDTGGKNYVYKHTAVKYDANSQYTFNLKVMNGEAVALSGCEITGWTDKLTVNDGEAEDTGYTVDDDGTYHVTSAKGLEAWAEAVRNSGGNTIDCVLVNDIVMPAVADDESNWNPEIPFDGTFDGKGKTIRGLVFNKERTSNASFIAVNGGTVKNLTLENAKITGSSNIGAVAGDNNGIIENCHVTGESVITGSGTYVGGVVGCNNGKILACHMAKDCKVIGEMEVGGIAGLNNDNITGCYALCSLKGNGNSGGICGQNNSGLAACYSKCKFEATSLNPAFGGIAGDASSTAVCLACYWKEAENCTKGVGYGSDPSGMTKIEGWNSKEDSNLNDAMGKMNGQIGGKYQYVINPTTDNDAFLNEPLVLKKKQQ